MPIYECRCASCNQKPSLFARSTSAQVEAVCPQYGGDDMRRGKTPEGRDILHPES